MINPLVSFAHSGGEAFYPFLWKNYIGGMTPCLGLAGRNVPDVSPYRYGGTLFGSASGLTVTGSPVGPAIRFNGSTSIQWDGHSTLGNKFKVAGSYTADFSYLPLTIHAYFRYVHKGTVTKMSLFRSDNPLVSDDTEYGYHLYVEANGDSLVFESHRGEKASNPMPIYTATGELTGDKWHNVVVTYYPWDADAEYGQYVMMNIDGRWIRPDFNWPTITERYIIHSASKHSRCGSSFGNTAPDLEVALVEIWSQRLPWRTINLLMANPLAVFQRVKRRKEKINIGWLQPLEVVPHEEELVIGY